MSGRAGTALIMAVALLAALLLLGLPFIFMQSSSLAGARSLAARQQAAAVVEGLRAYGVAVGAETVRNALEPGPDGVPGTALGDNTGTLGLGAASAGATRPNRIDLALTPATGTPGSPLTGLRIEDEQGKLDANSLGATGWTRLFRILGIPDWDDSALSASARVNVGYADGLGNPIDDASSAGQLADAIAGLRLQRPFARLEDLLAADPGRNTGPAPLFRPPLTPAELERLRPHLTLSALGQGRAGMIDLGTVIDQLNDTVMYDLPAAAIDLLRTDAWLLAKPPGSAPAVTGYVRSVSSSGSSITLDILWADIAAMTAGTAIYRLIPPPVNIHQATAAVRTWYGEGGTAITTPPARLDAVADLFPGAWPATRLWGTAGTPAIAQPPLAIASFGWFSIAARCDIRDRAGNLLAGAQRAQVVQAVPQEEVVERRWWHQDDLAAQANAQTMPGLTTWPVAIDRLTDQGPATAAASAGLSLAPLATAATTSGWSLPLASGPATTAGVLKPSGGTATLLPSTWSPVAITAAMAPDGLRLNREPGDAARLAVRLDMGGPLPATTADTEMRPVSFALWFRPDDASRWRPPPGVAGLPIPLLEAAPDGSRTVRLPDGTAGSPALQNRFGLWYDPRQEMLVLEYAPPGAAMATATGALVNGDDPLTAAIDERSLAITGLGWTTPAPLIQPSAGWGGQAFTPVWLPNRIIHCYATPGGLTAGQWYRLQILTGSGRPGGMAMILDGCAGRGVNHIPAGTGYQLRWGDQCTLPALVLTEDLPAVDPGATLGTPQALLRSRIGATVPAFITAMTALAVDDLLPQRGAVMVDQEIISYQGLDATGLLRCQRGARQFTDTSQPVIGIPGSQAHARAAVAVPAGVRIQHPAAQLYTGGAVLAQDLPCGEPSPAMGYPQWSLSGAILGSGGPTTLVPLPATLSLDELRPSAAAWPTRGIAHLDGGSGGVYGYVYFVRSGATMTWHPIDAAVAGTVAALPTLLTSPANHLAGPSGPAQYDQAHGLGVLVCSVEIDAGGQDPTLPGFLHSGAVIDPLYPTAITYQPNPRLVQIGDAQHIEWLRYDAVVRCHNFPGGRRDFLFNARSHPWSAAVRGQERTAWGGAGSAVLPPTHVFPAGTAILPVQDQLSGSGGQLLATGDLLTILPPAGSATPGISIPVRFATCDGYQAPMPALPDPASNATRGLFAFDRRVDSLLPGLAAGLTLASRTLVAGSGWAASADLSPVPGGALAMDDTAPFPRLDQFAPSPSSAAAQGFLSIGSRTDGTAGAAMTVDAIASQGWGFTGTIPPGGWTDGGDAPLAAITAATVLAGTRIRPSILPTGSGLALIDGEVVAWRRPASTPAGDHLEILGRALLGSEAASHAMPPGGLPILLLPGWTVMTVGDAAHLTAGIPLDAGNARWFDLLDPATGAQAVWGATPLLLCDPAGAPGRLEVIIPSRNTLAGTIAVPNPQAGRYTAVDWLRGLYRTPVLDWSAGPAPLAIGWQPRHPSLLPPGTPTEEALRSRVFPSAGFPARWADARVPLSHGRNLLGPRSGTLLELLDGAAAVVAEPLVRVLACRTGDGTDHRFDAWSGQPDGAPGSFSNDPALAGYGDDVPTDGVELRVWWRYRDRLAVSAEDPGGFRALAEGANRSPAIAGAALGLHVPVRTLAVEEAR